MVRSPGSHGSTASCCPTNLARFIPSIPDYIYAVEGEALFVNLFAASRAAAVVGGARVGVQQTGDYPWNGRIALTITPDQPRSFELRVRIPGWARNEPVPSGLYRYADAAGAAYELRVNGEPISPTLRRGYAVIARVWTPGDTVTLVLPMPVRRVVADARVADTRDKVALERGPLVYAAEWIDNDGSVLNLVVPDGAAFEEEHRSDLLGGVTVVRAAATDQAGRPRRLTAIPYYAWSHRGPGEMAVWLQRRAVSASLRP